MKSAEIRERFLAFFAAKGHVIVPSSSLVPEGDPTLLFTNAGMNQFKDVFLGFDKRPYTRAASAQKCVRAGGKHNDLENVGYTARHHTFFEMLGNFSFGDYFKREAIHYAWELLVDVFKLPPERLWVTVYAEDDEAYDIWTKAIGVPVSRCIRIGDNKGARYASDNFWMMGDTGPCGPCTEIFYDHGPEVAGGPPGSAEADGDRYIEIWNNVFMQFNRDEQGIMHPLPKPSVDTGMGLERMAAVLQGVHSNYEIDLFQSLIRAAARETHQSHLDQPSLRVLADHIRATSFLIADGVIPGNEGRGFVLRRIIRRAVRHGWKLGVREPFFHRLVPDLVVEMGAAYPELVAHETRIIDMLRQEEERFFATIEHGMSIVEAELGQLSASGRKIFPGVTAFKLHDTYGFPLDLTADICREHGVVVDVEAFDAAMSEQKAQARAAGKFKMAAMLEYEGPTTDFRGYETLEAQGNVLALYKGGSPVNELLEGEEGVVVLDVTPFYAEAGGQVGDRGVLVSVHGVFAVEDTQKIQAHVFGHHGVVKTGRLSVGNGVTAKVDLVARARTARHHSATHLMHKALRDVLGPHVQQKGSLVDDARTRFDFTHPSPLSQEEISRIEAKVNAEILANTPTKAEVMPLEEAKKSGAVMLFGEKYGDIVRVLTIGDSKEFCGGTHVMRTGDIGCFKIVSESGVAAGIRRIEAVCGDRVLALMQQMERELMEAAALLKAPWQEIVPRVTQTLAELRAAEKELLRLKAKFATLEGEALAAQARQIKGVAVLAATLEGADAATLRETIDKLKNRLGSAVIVLGNASDGKVTLVAGVTHDLTMKLSAGELVGFVAQKVGGKGGGRRDLAQGGGTRPEALSSALGLVAHWVGERL
ncbi:MAG: alanine--tRNA ligase [Rhodocyclaceae bacterium]|nr:alanine--tRNA ligase [Rhodocyclaceae bacterium]